MFMFLTLLLASVAVTVVSCIMAAGLGPREEQVPEARPELKPVLDPPAFFAEEAPEFEAAPRIPLEVLVSQIQRHVRLEQAAAESFLHVPTAESLHSRTTSPLVN